MAQDNLGKIQIIVAIVVAVYVIMPDVFVGPLDDAAIAVIAGIAEAVMAVVRVISDSNSNTERMTDSHDNYGSFDNYGTY